MDRRRFLALTLAGGAALTGCGSTPSAAPSSTTTTPPPPTTPPPTTPPAPSFPAPQLTRVPIPPGRLTELPGDGSLLAWTVDDGDDSSVVRAYTEFGRDTGTRLTFFLNGSKPAWTENADLLRPWSRTAGSSWATTPGATPTSPRCPRPGCRTSCSATTTSC
ncbi:hypothetical protein ACFQX8_28400 [Klenkia terrae]|uniref:hypothetical protein n=1 Tax=Klenkia terrae TaxID=1052259 RepID=UPI00360C7159